MKISLPFIPYTLSTRHKDASLSNEEMLGRQQRAEHLIANNLPPPKLYFNGRIKLQKTARQQNLQDEARRVSQERAAADPVVASTPPQQEQTRPMARSGRTSRSSVSQQRQSVLQQARSTGEAGQKINEAQRALVLNGLNSWTYTEGIPDEELEARVDLATRIMRIVQGATVLPSADPSGGRLHIRLPQPFSLPDGLTAALRNANIEFQQPASSNLVRNVLNTWVDLKGISDEQRQERTAQATDIMRIVREATLLTNNDPSDGRLHLLLSTPLSLPGDLTIALHDANIEFHQPAASNEQEQAGPPPRSAQSSSSRRSSPFRSSQNSQATPQQARSASEAGPVLREAQLDAFNHGLNSWVHEDEDDHFSTRAPMAQQILQQVLDTAAQNERPGFLNVDLPETHHPLPQSVVRLLRDAGFTIHYSDAPVPPTRSGSMQAVPDSTPRVPISKAQLDQLRLALGGWADANNSGDMSYSKKIKLTTVMQWNAEKSTVHLGTDGRLHLFLPQMESLPDDLVAALTTAGIDLHEASSPVSSTRSQRLPQATRPAPGGDAVASGSRPYPAAATGVHQASGVPQSGSEQELARWQQPMRDWVLSLTSREGRHRRHGVATNILTWIRNNKPDLALNLNGLAGETLPPGFLQAFAGKLKKVQASLGDISTADLRLLVEYGVEVDYPVSTTR